jgi:hypothetical protein
MTSRPPNNKISSRRPGGPQGQPGYLDPGCEFLVGEELQPQYGHIRNGKFPQGTVWAALQTPTHADFLPYLQVQITSKYGGKYRVYSENLDGPLSEGFDPILLRAGQGQRFQKNYDKWPCPEGWVQSSDPGFCERYSDYPTEQNRTEFNGPPKASDSGLYSKHAYIPEKQYADTSLPKRTSYSDSTFSRSRDFRTGGYVVHYPPHSDPRVVTRLPLSKITDKTRYDPSWDLPPQRTHIKYIPIVSGDHYLI